MKHAAQMHDGKGAYQCQFCKKFFLRLNYLEMHRTYGCSANPQRARPLCDFCGRKFCQPQKLKVHIKRMHSGITMHHHENDSKCIFVFNFQTWPTFFVTSNANFVLNCWAPVPLYKGTRKRCTAGILQLLVVHDVKNCSKIEAT